MKKPHFCPWLLVGLVVAGVSCTRSDASPGPGTGGSSISSSGGKNGNGGATGAGGATGGQNSGGNAWAGAGGSGGSTTGSGGKSTGSGGQGAGATAGNSATGGKATGAAAGAETGGSLGTGGGATGGALATGGQGSGGRDAGGNTGIGGTATGASTGGTASKPTGGTTGSGGATGTSTYRPCPIDGTACKIMPFGDSITDGYNADTPGGYRVELFRLAHSAGKNISFVGSGWNGPDTVDGAAFPHNHEGHSGWTIDPAGGRSGISTLLKNDGTSQSVMLKYAPHIVLLMIGTNDAIDSYDLTNAPTRLGKLIDIIYSQLPDVLIVVAQPIPSRGDASKGDDTGLSARIKTYDDAIPAVVKARADAGKHILIVDMYAPFNANKASLIEDQWHPNLAGYVVLGGQWYSVLKSLL